MLLQELVVRSAERYPQGLAVRGPTDSMTYAEMDASANRMARRLGQLGVGPGARVGVLLDKSAQAVTSMQAILRVGAAYVPMDPMSPPLRARSILGDCQMHSLITTRERSTALFAGGRREVQCLLVDGDDADDSDGRNTHGLSAAELASGSPEPLQAPEITEDALAYILYTSGSTGKPKGVCISHRNALAFVEWAAAELGAGPGDRFANHAPFHFDLSVLDLYAAFWAGASVHIIPETAAYIPQQLVEFLRSERPTLWYSVPSALIRMMEDGGLFELTDLSLRAICFAGEPFPVKHLSALQARFRGVRLLNLYGPTETNVCTFHEVKEAIGERTQPVPIGKASCGNQVWAATPGGERAKVGEEGELFVSGPTVMLGYWGSPPQGDRPYATGDLVKEQENGDYVYLGRRDQMVKVRGYRVELGDIEAALLEHPALREVAVVVRGEGAEARLVAAVSVQASVAAAPPLLELKKHCAERLPRYMIIDKVRVLQSLPRTRNGKVDRAEIMRHLEAEGR